MTHHQITEELLPCPFCGEQPECKLITEPQGHVHYYVECNHSGSKVCVYTKNQYETTTTAEFAIAAWNRRPAWKAGQDAPAQPIAEKAEPDHRASPLDVDLSWLRKAVYSYPPVEAQHALHRVEQRLTAQEPQAGQWQPIDTAPKDGTPILLAGAGKVERAIWDYARPWIDGWWCEGHRSDAVGPDFVPTHWMPLPPPPQCEKAQEE